MTTNMFKFALMLSAAQLAIATPSMAQDAGAGLLAKERFQVRVRAIDVAPDEKSTVNIGGNVDVGNAVMPEVDVTYFLTEKVGLELIAATSKHSLTYTGNTDIGDTWVLPPTITLQYHPLRGTDSKFSPYVGAGLNYSMFYGEDEGAGFSALDVEGGVGYALQVGTDYWLNDHWGLNLDVKKVWLDVEADTNLGATAVHTDVDLDPWIIGVGASYRF